MFRSAHWGLRYLYLVRDSPIIHARYSNAVSDADRVRVSFSGLEMADRVFTQRLIRALGM